MPKIVHCGSCGARMFWAITFVKKKPIPIDAEPVPNGNIQLVNGEAVYVNPNLWDPESAEPLYQSHFVSCPNSAEHRKPKEKK